MKLTIQEFNEVLEAEDSIDPRYPSDWLVLEEGEWIQNGKQQIRTSIVKHLLTNICYSYTISRTGSPYTYWYYSYEDDEYIILTPVELVEKTVIVKKWINI